MKFFGKRRRTIDRNPQKRGLPTLSSGWQVAYGWFFQLPVYATSCAVLLRWVVSENSVIPGLVFACVVGFIHVLITAKQTKDWNKERLCDGYASRTGYRDEAERACKM